MKTAVLVILILILLVIIFSGIFLLYSKKEGRAQKAAKGLCLLLVPLFTTFFGVYVALYLDREDRREVQINTAESVLNLCDIEVFQIIEQFEVPFNMHKDNPKFSEGGFGFFLQRHFANHGYPFPVYTEELIQRDVVLEQTTHAFKNEVLLEFVKIRNCKLYIENVEDNEALSRYYFTYRAHLYFLLALIQDQRVYLKGEVSKDKSDEFIRYNHDQFLKNRDKYMNDLLKMVETP